MNGDEVPQLTMIRDAVEQGVSVLMFAGLAALAAMIIPLAVLAWADWLQHRADAAVRRRHIGRN